MQPTLVSYEAARLPSVFMSLAVLHVCGALLLLLM